MTTAQGSWLRQGFFVLGDDRLMPSVRDELERALALRGGTLHIKYFPTMGKWKHTYWWREGDLEYAEAQFLVQVAKEYPVLSLGVAIEKGFETPDATTKPQKLMDRGIWDWPHFIDHVEHILSHDVALTADALREPVTVRIRSKAVVDGEGGEWATRAFSYVDGTWFERYVGSVETARIADHIRELDAQKNLWGIVHFARDIGPADAEGLSAQQIASSLIAFDAIRKRMKG